MSQSIAMHPETPGTPSSRKLPKCRDMHGTFSAQKCAPHHLMRAG
jgi:hypothetical protein